MPIFIIHTRKLKDSMTMHPLMKITIGMQHLWIDIRCNNFWEMNEVAFWQYVSNVFGHALKCEIKNDNKQTHHEGDVK